MSVVIWTLARTGGTALTAVLRQLLGRPPAFHEPLNPTEIWGSITSGMADDADLPSLTAEIARRLRDRPVVKHCLEPVPFRITEALAHACIAGGYRHIVLIRRDETARMMSWLFMAATGAASRAALDGLSRDDIEARLTKLTKAHFVSGARHSRTSVGRLDRLKALLEGRGTRHLVVAYEDVFLQNQQGAQNPAFSGAMRFLDIDASLALKPENAAAVKRWLIDEGQRSQRYYPFMTRQFIEPPTFETRPSFAVGEYDFGS